MKSLIIAATLFAAAVPALAQPTITISLGQPNFYGQIDPAGMLPQLYSRQPVIIERQTSYGQPVYLRVPPGHRKHWNKNCHKYNACGQQVFFVQDGWYNNTYAPRYREQHHGSDVRAGHREERRDEYRGRDDDRGHGKSHDKHDKGDKGGKGHGNGNGKGHGKHGD